MDILLASGLIMKRYLPSSSVLLMRNNAKLATPKTP